MRVIIIEDEIPAAKRLEKMLESIGDEIVLLKKLDSVSSSVEFFRSGVEVDLVFMDIQLADGLSFDIFQQVEIKFPIIFTTAFDGYTLKAFKVNSIDYLLKPIDEQELLQAVQKYRQLYLNKEKLFSENIKKLVQDLSAARYKERLMIKRGQQLSYIKTENIAYCYADGKLCYTVDFNNAKYLLESNLSQLEEQLQPNQFFRVSRHLLINIEAISKVHTWFGGRLKLELTPPTEMDTLVSRERVNSFRKWLGE